MSADIKTFVKPQWLFAVAAALCMLFGHYLGYCYKLMATTPQLVQKINADIHPMTQTQRAAFEQADGVLRKDYLSDTNELLRQHDIGLKLNELEPRRGVTVQHELVPYGIDVQYTTYQLPWLLMLITGLCSGLLCNLLQRHTLSIDSPSKTDHSGAPNCVLTIDLDSRSLTLGNRQASTPLANKPLSLYVALLKYCSDTKQPFLTTTEPLPAAVSSICQRVFAQLMEKGHSKRRPPDFDSALDKSLSEIRRVVEELCEGDSELQRIFVPPKAVGKGARRQRHNFALKDISQHDYNITNN